MNRWSAAALGALVALAAGNGPVSAQQPSGSSPAWIGVGIPNHAVCVDSTGRPGVGGGCKPVVLVETVVVGGPADQAGMAAGDTLVSVDGHALGTAGGERALAALRPGVPVRVVVGRSGGRRTLQITPEERPVGPHLLRVRLAGAGSDEAGVFRIRVLADPSRLGSVGSWPSFSPSPAAPEARSAGLPSPAAPGTTGLSWQLGASGHRLPWPGLHSVAADSVAVHMQALEDSVLAEARIRLDSLRSVYRAYARSVLEGNSALAPAEGIARLAGAEFRTLTPALSEYFQGADHGLLVLRVLPGTPAAMLGLEPGDVVVRAAGQDVRDNVDLRSALVRVAPRDSVTVQWVRKGKTVTGVLKGR